MPCLLSRSRRGFTLIELVVVIASVETLPAVKSDLQIRILKAFRAKEIRVAAQLPVLPPPVVVSLDEALGLGLIPAERRAVAGLEDLIGDLMPSLDERVQALRRILSHRRQGLSHD